MADYKLPIITGTALTIGDVLRWDGSDWVNYADDNYGSAGGLDLLDGGSSDVSLDTLILDAKAIESSPDHADISDNDVATDVTGVELEELSNGSETTLHTHAGGYTHSGAALNGGAAVNITTAGTYITVATGLSARALCYIKVQNVSGDSSTLTVRDADETGDWNHVLVNQSNGPAKVFSNVNKYGVVIVPCNASGDIEITTAGNTKSWKLWLMGHI